MFLKGDIDGVPIPLFSEKAPARHSSCCSFCPTLRKRADHALNRSQRRYPGIDAYPVHVEVDTDRSLPTFTVVGLPDSAVRESKERVLAALRNSGFQWPRRRVTVNLAPADRRKEGSAFDLPIALGILIASQQIRPARLSDFAFLGELSLDGTIRPIHGALSMALGLRQRDVYGLVVPADNAREAATAGRPLVYGAGVLCTRP